jgi:hypothetical protein
MKRIFCDCCGGEFKYDEQHRIVNGKSNDMRVGHKTNLDIVGELEITFSKLRIAGTVADGQHVDLCTDCRWKAIDRLDTRPKESSVVNIPHLEIRTILKIFDENVGASAVGTYYVSNDEALVIVNCVIEEIRSRQ